MDFSNFTYYAPQAYNIGSVSFNWFSSFSDGLSKIVTNFFAIITGIVQSGQALIDGLLDISDILSDMNASLLTGETDGYPILEAVGAYRYLVGDFLFYLTYLVIAFSLMLTIWHLVRLIYTRVTKIANSGAFGTGLLSRITSP